MSKPVTLQGLVDEIRADKAALYDLENDLMEVEFLHRKDRNAHDAVMLLHHAVKALVPQTAVRPVVLEGIRRALAALRPYADELPGSKVASLMRWYQVDIPASELPEAQAVPPLPEPLWNALLRSSVLPNLESLAKQAARQGWKFRCVEELPATSKRYELTNPVGQSSLVFYSDVVRAVHPKTAGI